jgi:hypothetical protein
MNTCKDLVSYTPKELVISDHSPTFVNRVHVSYKVYAMRKYKEISSLNKNPSFKKFSFLRLPTFLTNIEQSCIKTNRKREMCGFPNNFSSL